MSSGSGLPPARKTKNSHYRYCMHITYRVSEYFAMPLLKPINFIKLIGFNRGIVFYAGFTLESCSPSTCWITSRTFYTQGHSNKMISFWLSNFFGSMRMRMMVPERWYHHVTLYIRHVTRYSLWHAVGDVHAIIIRRIFGLTCRWWTRSGRYYWSGLITTKFSSLEISSQQNHYWYTILIVQQEFID